MMRHAAVLRGVEAEAKRRTDHGEVLLACVVRLCAEARRHNLPRQFAKDIEHDADVLLAGREVPELFGWVLYRCGTHMVYPAVQMALQRGLPHGFVRDEYTRLFHTLWQDCGGAVPYVVRRGVPRQVTREEFESAMLEQLGD